jgi:hypothetical protein
MNVKVNILKKIFIKNNFNKKYLLNKNDNTK